MKLQDTVLLKQAWFLATKMSLPETDPRKERKSVVTFQRGSLAFVPFQKDNKILKKVIEGEFQFPFVYYKLNEKLRSFYLTVKIIEYLSSIKRRELPFVTLCLDHLRFMKYLKT